MTEQTSPTEIDLGFKPNVNISSSKEDKYSELNKLHKAMDELISNALKDNMPSSAIVGVLETAKMVLQASQLSAMKQVKEKK